MKFRTVLSLAVMAVCSTQVAAFAEESINEDLTKCPVLTVVDRGLAVTENVPSGTVLTVVDRGVTINEKKNSKIAKRLVKQQESQESPNKIAQNKI